MYKIPVKRCFHVVHRGPSSHWVTTTRLQQARDGPVCPPRLKKGWFVPERSSFTSPLAGEMVEICCFLPLSCSCGLGSLCDGSILSTPRIFVPKHNKIQCDSRSIQEMGEMTFSQGGGGNERKSSFQTAAFGTTSVLPPGLREGASYRGG